MPTIGSNYEELKTQQEASVARNSFSDLAVSTNGIWGKMKREEHQSQVDVSGVSQLEFTDEALLDAIKDEPIETYGNLSGATSWADLERKRSWNTELYTANKNAMDTYGIPGMLAAGVTLGLVDYDAPIALASGGLYKGTVSGLKALKLSDRMSKVAAASITGGAFSVANNIMYESAVDSHIEGSNINAAMLGIALGGGIGAWATRVPKTRKVFTDDNNVKAELTKAEARASELDDLNLAKEELHKEHTSSMENVTKLETIIAEVGVKAKAAKTRIAEISKDASYKVRDAIDRTTKREESIALTAKRKATAKAEAELEVAIVKATTDRLPNKKIEAMKDELKALRTNSAKLKTEQAIVKKEIKRLENRTKGMKGPYKEVDHTDAINTTKQLDKEAQALQKQLDGDNATIKEHQATLAGDYQPKLNRIKALQAKQQTTIDSVHEEIKKSHASIQTLAKTMEVDAAGMDFGWMNSMFISPKMKNFASKNPAVQGLTSLLESMTVAGYSTTGKYVKNTKNAANVKDGISGKLAQTFTNKEKTGVVDTYYTAIDKGEFTGTYHEWEAKVSQNSYRKIGEAIEEQTGNFPRNRDDLDYAKLREEALAKVKIKYDGSEVDKASKSVLDGYFGMISKRAHEAGMDKFGNIHGLYMPHIWDGTTMKSPDAVERLVNAQIRYAEHFNMKVDIPSFEASAKAAAETSQDGYQHIIHKMNDPMSPTTDKTSRLKARSIQVFDHDVADLLSSNLEQTMKGYDLSMSGKLALQETIGLSSVDDIMQTVVSKVTSDPGELARFRTILNNLTGIQEISKQRGTLAHNVMQTLTKTTSLAFMPGFAMPALTEITNAVGLTGYNKIMKDQFGAIKSAADLLRNKSLSVKTHNDLVGIANIGSSRWSFHVNRMDGDMALNSTTKLHNILDSANHKASKIFGLQPVTEASRILAGSSGINWLLDVAGNPNMLKGMDDRKLARMGLDRNDLNNFAAARKHVEYDADGRLVDWHMDKWDPEVHDKMRNAVYEHINTSILHPDGASLPMWITDPDSWIAKITMQFMRFPMDSYEKLTMRGLSEFDGKQASGMVGNMAVWYMVTSFRDALKVEDKRRYAGEEGQIQQYQDIIGMSSLAGGPLSMVSKGMSMAGQAPLGGYSPGPASSLSGAAGSVANKMTSGKAPGLYGVLQDRLLETKLIGDYVGE